MEKDKNSLKNVCFTLDYDDYVRLVERAFKNKISISAYVRMKLFDRIN